MNLFLVLRSSGYSTEIGLEEAESKDALLARYKAARDAIDPERQLLGPGPRITVAAVGEFLKIDPR